MLINEEQILKLLPQSAPMVMVDAVLYSDEQKTTTAFFIKKENIFCENGFLREPGMIENIAQSAATRSGYEQFKADKPAKTGYIGAIGKYKTYKLPLAEQEIRTEITVLNQIFDVTLIKGVISQNDEVMAECEMKIFIKNG